jgi:hypothetical protein
MTSNVTMSKEHGSEWDKDFNDNDDECWESTL